MKWLREISTQYFPGVGFDGENINFQNNNISWDENYFTILPLTDGNLIIKVYGVGTLATGITDSPSGGIEVSWRLKGNTTWTSISFTSPGGLNGTSGYVNNKVTLTAGVPIELSCSTGLTKILMNNGSGLETIYPGNISTDCPAVIMGHLESLAVGDINLSGTSTAPWTYYLKGLKELFKGWTLLVDASNLVMPNVFQSSSAQPDFTGLFSGCSSLSSSPEIVHGGIYTRCFEDCVSLRSVYANIHPTARAIYTLTDWLKGTHEGKRVIYIPATLDTNYDLCLPTDPRFPTIESKTWTREIFEF